MLTPGTWYVEYWNPDTGLWVYVEGSIGFFQHARQKFYELTARRIRCRMRRKVG